MYVFIFIDTEPGVYIIVKKLTLLFDHCGSHYSSNSIIIRQGKSFRKAGEICSFAKATKEFLSYIESSIHFCYIASLQPMEWKDWYIMMERRRTSSCALSAETPETFQSHSEKLLINHWYDRMWNIAQKCLGPGGEDVPL